jgi:hypothetical protein
MYMSGKQSVQTMTIRVLGNSDRSYMTTLLNRRDSNLLFTAPSSIPAAAAIEAHVQGTAIMGEVVWCRPREGQFEVLVHARHSVSLSRNETCPWLK